QDTLCGAFEIVVLPALQGPHERGQAGQPHPDRNRNQKEEIDHETGPAMIGVVIPTRSAAREGAEGPWSRRNALATTMTEDSDIATAAINGVTWPRTATGIAIKL